MLESIPTTTTQTAVSRPFNFRFQYHCANRIQNIQAVKVRFHWQRVVESGNSRDIRHLHHVPCSSDERTITSFTVVTSFLFPISLFKNLRTSSAEENSQHKPQASSKCHLKTITPTPPPLHPTNPQASTTEKLQVKPTANKPIPILRARECRPLVRIWGSCLCKRRGVLMGREDRCLRMAARLDREVS